MRILILSALLVAVTQAAPRIEGNILRPRYDLDLGYDSNEPTYDEINLAAGARTDETDPSQEEIAEDPFGVDPTTSTDTAITGDEGSDIDFESDKGVQKVPKPGDEPQDSTTPTGQPTAPPEGSPSNGNPSPGAPSQGYPQNPQNPQGSPSSQPPTASDPSVFQWFDSPPSPTGASGCWNAQNPNTGSRAEMCQLCLPSGCTDAERVNSTKGWRLCKREKNGRVSVGPHTCIVAKKAP